MQSASLARDLEEQNVAHERGTTCFCKVTEPPVHADEPSKESDEEKPDMALIDLITNPIIAILLLCPVLMAAGFTFLDPVLGPHLSAQGYTAGMVGAAFGVVSAVYACLSPATGCASQISHPICSYCGFQAFLSPATGCASQYCDTSCSCHGTLRYSSLPFTCKWMRFSEF